MVYEKVCAFQRKLQLANNCYLNTEIKLNTQVKHYKTCSYLESDKIHMTHHTSRNIYGRCPRGSIHVELSLNNNKCFARPKRFSTQFIHIIKHAPYTKLLGPDTRKSSDIYSGAFSDHSRCDSYSFNSKLEETSLLCPTSQKHALNNLTQSRAIYSITWMSSGLLSESYLKE